jgi:hypothetical protein
MAKDLKVGERVWYKRGSVRTYGTVRQTSGSFVTIWCEGDVKTPPHTFLVDSSQLHREGEDE